MQETEFIKQNKDKWAEFESVLGMSGKDPERITELFIETTDDLSYSRTYYPNRSVRVYLNGISKKVYQTIYSDRKKNKKAFSKFWKEELPDAMWFNRKTLLLSFFIFTAGISIGIFSGINYPDFARIILGNEYVEMTEANIEKGDPMAVYESSEPIGMFLQIALNNIRISFAAFILGAIFGFGTIYLLLFNGIMVGAFIYFFIERGLFKESFLAIMLHGTTELSMIVLAGCAGLTLARGVLFPGTYTRTQALVLASRSGIKILVAVTLLLLYAAFIESFATRHTETPDWIRGLIILLTAILVVGYFVWYPALRHKKGLIQPTLSDDPPPYTEKTITFKSIKKPGTIIMETFKMFSGLSKKLSQLSLLVALLTIVIIGFAIHGQFNDENASQLNIARLTEGASFWCWFPYESLFNFERNGMIYLSLSILMGVLSVTYFQINQKKFNFEVSKRKTISQVFQAVVISAITLVPTLLENSALTVLISFLTWPICMLWLVTSLTENKGFFQSLSSTARLISKNMRILLSAHLNIFLIQWLGLLIFNGAFIIIFSAVFFASPVNFIDLFFEFIRMNIPRNFPLAEEIPAIIYYFLCVFGLALLFALNIFAAIVQYHSLKEISTASELQMRISKIGFKKRAYGLEQEA
jgi:uncharacterized membrane protein SpoIIM required for sporulation